MEQFAPLGVAGIVCCILWVMLGKSEDREKAKDLRIQLLENELRESYNERIEASAQIATALVSNSHALELLTAELKRQRAP